MGNFRDLWHPIADCLRLVDVFFFFFAHEIQLVVRLVIFS